MAGLIKTVLSLQHRQIPPTLHFERPNPRIDFARSPFYVNATLSDWPDGGPRRAGVSAFGMGGTNAHVIIEEAPPPAPRAVARPGRTAVVLPLSGKTEPAARALADRYRRFLEQHPDTDLDDLCFTASTGRQHFGHRIAAVGGSAEELRAELGRSAPVEVPAASGKLGFLFTGQGAHYEGMGRQLYSCEPRFRAVVDRCDRFLRAELDLPLTEILYPAPGAGGRLHRIDCTQAAMLAFEVALAELWMSWGIQPDLVMGHSTGEYAAACVAGVMSLEDGLRLSVERGRLFERRVSPDGRMVTALAPEAQVAELVAGDAGEVSIAAVNGPLSTVVSGRAAAVDRICARLAAAGIETRALSVPRAGHSPLTEPMLDELEALVAGVELCRPAIPLVSNVTGALAGGEVASPAYWRRHTREPVRFAAGIQALRDAGAATFLEIGPDAVLVGMAAFCLMGQRTLHLPSLRRPTAGAVTDECGQLLGGLARLYLAGRPVDWAALDRGRGRRIELPTYPFQRQRHWIDAQPGAAAGAQGDWPDWLLRVGWHEQPADTAAAPAGPTAVPAGPAAVPADTAADPATAPAPDQVDSWLILADEGGTGWALLERLRARGARCAIATGADRLAVDRLLDAAEEPVRNIVYLAGLDPAPAGARAPDGDATRAAWRQCEVLLRLAQTLAVRDGATARLWLVTRGAQAVVTGDAVDGLMQAPLWAMARVIGMEHPELRAVRIDLDADTPLDSLVAELYRPAADVDEDAVALRGGARHVARLEPHPVATPSRPALRDDAGYLVIGGLGGLGLLVARRLVERGARHLVLAGRSQPGAEAAAVVESLRAAGATVTVARADVTCRAEVERLFDQLERPLAGIVHAAGVIDDGVVQQLDHGRFEKVLAPKVQGAWNLHQVAEERAPALDHFVLFSSAASLIGNAGQANHAAANGFLDALAHHRRALGRPALAVNWGAWTEAGELVHNQAARERLGRLGFGAIPSAEGLAALDHLMTEPAAQVGVAPMDWRKAVREFHLGQVGFFAGQVVDDDQGASFRDQLARVAPEARRPLLLAHVRAQAAHVLGSRQAGALDDDRRLAEYGIDSLSSIELRNNLQSSLGQSLPATLVFERPTIAALVDHLAALRFDPPTQDPARPAAAAQVPLGAGRAVSMQQRRWLSLIAAGYGQRVVPIVFETALDRPALRAALRLVIERHELLRYRFPGGEIEAVPAEQVLPDDSELFLDLRGLEGEARRQALGAATRACRDTMPDPAQRPSWAVRCVDLAPDRFALLLSLQHLDFDGSSLTTWVDELREAYRARLRGCAPQLVPVAPYHEYAAWQQGYMAGDVRQERAFFQGMYASLQRTTTLPGHAGFARTVAHESARVTPPAVAGLWDRVQSAAGSLGVTPFSLMLATWATVIGEITGGGEVVIAMIVNGRSDPRFARTIGPFTAPFPVKVVTAGLPIPDIAVQCHQVLAAINARSFYPVADLVEHVPAFRGLPIDTYFSDVGINFTSYRREASDQEPRVRVMEILGPIEDPDLAAAGTEELRRIPGLHLVIDRPADELRFNLWYHRHRFAEAQVAGWASRIVSHLTRAVSRTRHDVPTLTHGPADADQLGR